MPSACRRQSSSTSGGISLNVRAISPGSRSTSSRYPSTGMKSGIRSMGDRASASVTPASSLATTGVRFHCSARYTAGMSRFREAARAFRFKSHPSATFISVYHKWRKKATVTKCFFEIFRYPEKVTVSRGTPRLNPGTVYKFLPLPRGHLTAKKQRATIQKIESLLDRGAVRISTL